MLRSECPASQGVGDIRNGSLDVEALKHLGIQVSQGRACGQSKPPVGVFPSIPTYLVSETHALGISAI